MFSEPPTIFYSTLKKLELKLIKPILLAYILQERLYGISITEPILKVLS